jgi:hypothetical protein
VRVFDSSQYAMQIVSEREAVSQWWDFGRCAWYQACETSNVSVTLKRLSSYTRLVSVY